MSLYVIVMIGTVRLMQPTVFILTVRLMLWVVIQQPLNLTITNSSSSSEAVTACDSYDWNGDTYTASGTYTFETTNAVGCDSTATLNLTIINSTTSSEDVSACDSYDWNGETYTASGTYTFETTNVAGCDSIATLILEISQVHFLRLKFRHVNHMFGMD